MGYEIIRDYCMGPENCDSHLAVKYHEFVWEHRLRHEYEIIAYDGRCTTYDTADVSWLTGNGTLHPAWHNYICHEHSNNVMKDWRVIDNKRYLQRRIERDGEPAITMLIQFLFNEYHDSILFSRDNQEWAMAAHRAMWMHENGEWDDDNVLMLKIPKLVPPSTAEIVMGEEFFAGQDDWKENW